MGMHRSPWQALVLWLIITGSLAAADPQKTFEVGGFTFTRPDGWKWVESTSPMRKAQLEVPAEKGGSPADIVFFYFGQGQGGGTKANVDRWFGQFQETREKINARTEETTVGQRKVTYVTADGTYKSGMPGGAQTAMPDYALLGAIIESERGNVFVRLTGPKNLVHKSTAAFKKMIESALKL